MADDCAFTPGEGTRCSQIAERIDSLRRQLNEHPLGPLDDPAVFYRYLALIKQTQGNLSNDISFVACLLAKRYLHRHHGISTFDAALKAQGAPGLDVDARTPAGERVIAEIKTTDPYKESDFGSQQIAKFRDDFAKLNRNEAAFKYLFVTEQKAYDILKRKYEREVPGVRIVLLSSRDSAP